MSAGRKPGIWEDVGAAERATLADRIHEPTSRLSKLKNFILITALVIGAIGILVFRDRILLLPGDFLVIQDDLHSADVIHVIAGDDYRTDYAIDLYEQGLGKMLFFTGGWCKIHQYRHGEHAEERSLAAGVPLQAIAFDDSVVTSTYMEAERLKEWISHSPTPVHSVIVVSDPFHMRRARWTYRKVLGDNIEVQMAPVPFDLTPYQRAWWKDHESRLMVREEYVKFAYYLARYQYSSGLVRDWLASLDQDQ